MTLTLFPPYNSAQKFCGGGSFRSGVQPPTGIDIQPPTGTIHTRESNGWKMESKKQLIYCQEGK